MTKIANGSVNWKWLGPMVFLFAFGLVSYIGNGISSKVDAHEKRIQELEKNFAVQHEILARIEFKIDSLIAKKE